MGPYEPDWEAVDRAGLLADAPDVEDRKELLRLLAAEGLTLEEMVAAHRTGSLMRVVGERTIRPGVGTLTLREVAAQAGTDVEVVQRILRTLRAIVPEADDGTSSPDDVELVDCALVLLRTFGEETGWALLRRYGIAVERLTEAISAAVIREHPDISTLHSGSEATTARTWGQIAGTVPRGGRLLDLALRHQVEAVRRYFERAGAGQTNAASFVLGVGFADLSGYTEASLLLDLQDLAGVIAAYEVRATDAIAEHGGRLVKFVGDAVLFVCDDPDALVSIAHQLVTATATGDPLQARAGLARGPVLARDGDYFGPAVNLAARLVDVAPASTVLLDEGLRSAVDPSRWELAAEAPLQVRGIDAPVHAFRLLAQR
jgi:class 3 adenylate cyclase